MGDSNGKLVFQAKTKQSFGFPSLPSKYKLCDKRWMVPGNKSYKGSLTVN